MPNAEAPGLDAAVPPGTGAPVTGPRPGAQPAAPGAPIADDGHPARWWIMAVLAAVAFMAQLDR